jgi:hypothetical protein
VETSKEPVLTNIFSHPRFLVWYSATVTLAFAAVVVFGLGSGSLKPVQAAGKHAEFDRIRAHRIDLVEPDGTPRLILSNKADYPGSFFHGKEVDRSDRRDSAGMLMINDEGTEDGGFIFGGVKADGKPTSFSHLSFDQYDQDQTLVLGTALYPDGTRDAGISLNDAPDQPITPELYTEAAKIKAMPHGPERAAAWSAFMKKYPSLTPRGSFARGEDGSIALTLRDKTGQARLQLIVADNGQPAIKLLNAKGDIERSIGLP